MSGTEISAFLESGKIFYDQDNYDKAIIEFKKVIDHEPNHEEAKKYLASSYFNRGIHFYRNGEQDKAIADLTESINFNQKDAAAYGARGSLLDKKKDYDGVIRDFSKVIDLAPTAIAHATRGDAYYEKSKQYYGSDKNNYLELFKLAIKDLKEAVDLDQKNDIFQKRLTFLSNELEKNK